MLLPAVMRMLLLVNMIMSTTNNSDAADRNRNKTAHSWLMSTPTVTCHARWLTCRPLHQHAVRPQRLHDHGVVPA